MRPAISIDFGAAYTKIAVRENPDSTSRLLSHERLNLDEARICIPTIAAWRERDDRWVFGPDAFDLKSGNGIHVFRNWKPILFAPPGEILDPESSIGRLFYYNLDGGNDNWPPIKKLAVKYFEWLLEVMLPSLLDYRDLDDPVIRISVPDFDGETLYAYQMEEILIEAGWNSPWIFCEPEPMTNLTGALSQGRNTMIDDDGTIYPDIHAIFSGSGLLDYVNLSSDEEPEGDFNMLLVDIGAYTTDFSLVSVGASSAGGLPPLEAHSEPYGVEMLDALVKHGLSPERADVVKRLSATERELFRRTVYSDGRAWTIDGVTIGGASDRVIVDKCVDGMTTRLANEVERFVSTVGVDRIDEVVFTGGGSNIPPVTQKLAEKLAPKGVKKFHSSSLPLDGEFPCIRLGHDIVRASSALGGASVLFGDE